jgi:hypothetical protein
VSLPEDVSLITYKKAVVRVRDFSTAERRSLREHDKQDNSSGEKIDTSTRVRLA